MSGFREEDSAVKKSVAKLSLAVENSRILRVGTEKKPGSAEMQLSLIKHQEKSFDETMAAGG